MSCEKSEYVLVISAAEAIWHSFLRALWPNDDAVDNVAFRRPRHHLRHQVCRKKILKFWEKMFLILIKF
jgi:hypothetical protein